MKTLIATLACVALAGCMVGEEEQGGVKGLSGGKKTTNLSEAEFEKKASDCVNNIFWNMDSNDQKARNVDECKLMDGSNCMPVVSGGGLDYYTNFKGNSFLVKGAKWRKSDGSTVSDKFERVDIDMDACDCLMEHNITIGINDDHQAVVGLPWFQRRGKLPRDIDRFTFEETDENTRIVVRNIGTDGYCKLKITAIPKDKDTPITEEVTLGGGDAHDEVEVLPSPRPQVTDSPL